MNAGALLLEAAARFPERPALWLDERLYSYREIAGQVSAWAQTLHRFEGQVCAILGERSLASYCAPLACLLAGKTFVPLGAAFPAQRMLAMLERAGAGILVADAHFHERLQALLRDSSRPLQVLVAGAAGDEAATGPGLEPGHHTLVPAPQAALPSAAVLESPLGQVDPAYVLFTSGSSGQPKGVAVGHRALLAYVAAVRSRYPELDHEQRCTQFFEPTFDLSLHDLFVTWSVGACLYCTPRNALMLPVDFVDRHRISVWFSVPSMAATLQRYRLLKPDAMPSLRLALFCGEALPGPLAGQWLQAAPAARTENIYGPTEATIACTAHPVSPADALLPVVPIGTPLEGMHAVVLDATDRPVPTGQVGELHLGGSQLADGYWGQDDLTAERFRTIHITGIPVTRWYRTGDLARVDEAGVLHFRGRADRQVKIRGYRVELQEIEAVLREVCDSSQVAVLPLPAAAGDAIPGVAAFIAGTAVDAGGITAGCKRRMPAYMVPAPVLLVDALPLNSNGKTDYHQLGQQLAEALPARAGTGRRPGAAGAAEKPGTEVAGQSPSATG